MVYIKHNNLSAGTRTFKPDTHGAELVPEMKIVSGNIFIKSKGNALTCKAFADFAAKNEITDFYVAGADAVACVKSTCFNMRKSGYGMLIGRYQLPDIERDEHAILAMKARRDERAKEMGIDE